MKKRRSEVWTDPTVGWVIGGGRTIMFTKKTATPTTGCCLSGASAKLAAAQIPSSPNEYFFVWADEGRNADNPADHSEMFASQGGVFGNQGGVFGKQLGGVFGDQGGVFGKQGGVFGAQGGVFGNQGGVFG